MYMLLWRNRPYITSLATDWNEETQRFDSLCAGQTCEGNSTGYATAGTVSRGTINGNGAGAPVTYVGGCDFVEMQWGAQSISTSFTICSVTRYSGGGGSQKVILSSRSNPLGHWNW